MRQLLNTLFVTSQDAYLTLDGENVVVKRGETETARFPLHNLTSIISFSYAGASPALMGKCVDNNIDMVFCTPWGKFLARASGIVNGNVLLRRQQYRIADDLGKSCCIARYMIYGKVFNARWNLERTKRDHGSRIDESAFFETSNAIKELLPQIKECTDMDTLRGLEGASATLYFGKFDNMVLQGKPEFSFEKRNRRPPLDRVNAMLSFAYSLLSHDCASALESVGLDPYVGFMHRDRPGRNSLALDLMEELRPSLADRFVITLINNRVIKASDFEIEESKAVRMTEDGRKKFLKAWQEKKQEEIKHPYLEEKIPWGLVPYVQSLLLSRHIRGDLEAYPPFLWK